MSRGRYRHEVRIEQRTETTNAAGQVKASGWSTFLSGLFAEILWPAGDEPLHQGYQRRAFLNPLVRLPRTPETATITARHRVLDVCCTRTFNVQAVRDATGRLREIELECVEDVSQGGPAV